MSEQQGTQTQPTSDEEQCLWHMLNVIAVNSEVFSLQKADGENYVLHAVGHNCGEYENTGDLREITEQAFEPYAQQAFGALAGDLISKLKAERKKDSVSLDIGQIAQLAEFAGLDINKENPIHKSEPEQLETEMTIYQDIKIQDDDGSEETHSLAVCFSEYPEEGFLPLIPADANK